MIQRLKSYLSNISNREEPTSIVLIIFFFYFSIFGIWYTSTTSYFLLDLKIISAGFLSIIISGLLLFSNLLLIAHINEKSTNNFSWYLESLKDLFNSKMWESKSWWIFFIPIQITNLFLSILYQDRFIIWFSLLPFVIFGTLLASHMKRYKKLVTFFFGNILFAVTVFVFFNFKSIGVYFLWYLTRNICLINLGFEDKGDPLSNIEDFSNIKEWESFDNPLPDDENQLEFFTCFFWDSFFFYLYPIIIIIILFNTHYIFGKLVKFNLK